MTSELKIAPALAIQLGAYIVALAIGWGVMKSNNAASAQSLSDHETRIRTLEKDNHDLRRETLLAISETKSEIRGIKIILGTVSKHMKLENQ